MNKENSAKLERNYAHARAMKNVLTGKNIDEKIAVLIQVPLLQKLFSDYPTLKSFFEKEFDGKYELLLIFGLGQAEVLFGGNTLPSHEMLLSCAHALHEIEKFYACIGGILGYYLETTSRFFPSTSVDAHDVEIVPPPCVKLGELSDEYAIQGLAHLKECAEVYVVGGAGDRLNLVEKDTRKPLPAARLIFCGKTLLEGLIRDLEGREALYESIYGVRLITPIIFMTSLEKQNDQEIERICEEANWFGRPKESFFRIIQPLAPIITCDGDIAISSPCELQMKPGGHGVIWKLAEEQGAFKWLLEQGKKYILIRQINNPLAGFDKGMLSLLGYGVTYKKGFGFLSCPRKMNAAEGVNVLKVEKKKDTRWYSITNIEYTEFEKYLGGSLKDNFDGFFANTNILFASIETLRKAIEKLPIPGRLVNLKSTITIFRNGAFHTCFGTRLESTMQNIADSVQTESRNNLDTFLLIQERKYTMSCAKKAYQRGNGIFETPEGAFFDWQQVYREILLQAGWQVPLQQNESDFIEHGPNLLLFFHPALGPLKSIIQQKLRSGIMAHQAELTIDAQNVMLEKILLDGSLVIEDVKILTRAAIQPAEIYLNNVTIRNRGVDRDQVASYCAKLPRAEKVRIVLEEGSQFIAENINFIGDHTIVVPKHTCMIAHQKVDGKIIYDIVPHSSKKIFYMSMHSAHIDFQKV